MDIQKAFDLISSKLTLWLQELIRLLPNILLATIILVIGLFLATKFRAFAIKILNRFSKNYTLNNLFASIIHVFFIGVLIFIVLSVLHLDKAVTSILAGAGIAGLALAFAFQDIAANFISGIFISF
ncbi:MAG: mechanosensitive ion channel family protein, partial [Ferruginibacter sp.]